jgi:6-phosphogluconolactonase
LLCLLLAPAHLWGASPAGFIGTYTSHDGVSNGSSGIYRFEMDARSGLPIHIVTAAVVDNPSYLALSPNGRFLYAVNETGPESAGGRITAFAVGASGSAAPLENLGAVSSMGNGPCHLSLDAQGRWLLVANYGSGTIALFGIRPDGSLQEARQTLQHHDSDPRDASRPHAHQVLMSRGGRFVLALDLGLDRIFIYRFDPVAGALSPNQPAALQLPRGYGPRHAAFSKDGETLYVLTELAAKLITLRWDEARGTLAQLAEISVLPPGYSGTARAAELALSPDGRFLYASNRAPSNSIAAFRLQPHGLPQLISVTGSGGSTPRFIGIDPSGRFLLAANQDSDTLVSFRIDPRSGSLSRQRGDAHVIAPVDVLFAASR